MKDQTELQKLVDAYLAAGVSWDGSKWVNTQAVRAEKKLDEVRKILQDAINASDLAIEKEQAAGNETTRAVAKFHRTALMTIAVPCLLEISRLP